MWDTGSAPCKRVGTESTLFALLRLGASTVYGRMGDLTAAR